MKNHNTKSLIISVACILFSVCGIQAQAQELLNYPLDTINGVEVYRYHIERGIGIYRIGVNFNVSKEVLYRYNPELRNGVKYNQLVLIPTGRPVDGKKAPKAEQKAAQKPAAVETKPAVAETKPVIKETPVVAEKPKESKTVVVAPQPTPVVKEKQKIEAGRTIVIGPKTKGNNADQVSTLCIGPNKKAADRTAELNVIRIEPNKK
jgi:hypothetical protein